MGAKNHTVTIEENPFDKLQSGVDKAANVVKVTLGPRGRNVLIDHGTFMVSTRDGVSVAREIKLKDRMENMGALAIKEASNHTNSFAGDGTTTAAILAQSILREGRKFIAAGNNPMHIQRSIEEAVEKTITILKENCKQVKTEEEIRNVATISANNDKFLGDLIAQAVYKVGEKGNVLVETSNNGKTEVKFHDGIVIDRGFIDTDIRFADKGSRITNFENAKVAIIEQNISTFEPLKPLLEYSYKTKEPILIAIKDMDPTVLGLLLKNKLQGGVKIAVIITPGMGNYEIVEDFASSVGATPYHRDYNPLDVNSFSPSHLGTAERIIVDRHSTTIINGGGDINSRVEFLQKAEAIEEDENEKAKLQDRINKLTNSIAILSVSAESETELQDKRLRIEDSVNASRAAMSEGVVPGGGSALFRVAQVLNDSIGEQILKISLETPIRSIIGNTGENIEKVLSKIENESDAIGFDANSKEIVNLNTAGILDPVKVTRTAIQKAASVAGMLLTTGACIIREEEE